MLIVEHLNQLFKLNRFSQNKVKNTVIMTDSLVVFFEDKKVLILNMYINVSSNMLCNCIKQIYIAKIWKTSISTLTKEGWGGGAVSDFHLCKYHN